METTKRCPKCKKTKDLEQFFRNRSLKDGYQSYCKPCHTAASTAVLRGPLREKHLRMRKDSNLRRTHGISVERYEAMLEEQGGACCICGFIPESGERKLAVDHDHKCCPGPGSCGSCIRGLLCTRCNAGLGSFKDDVERMRTAIAYLKNWY